MTPAKALIIIAHGSRRAASNDEVRALTARLATRAEANFVQVKPAFLELAEPSIPEAIERCISEGAQHIVLLPYFLSAGTHVAEDLPELAQSASLQHPGVHIELRTHIGAQPAMLDLLLDTALGHTH